MVSCCDLQGKTTTHSVKEKCPNARLWLKMAEKRGREVIWRDMLQKRQQRQFYLRQLMTFPLIQTIPAFD